ncbi:beta-ketoacyl synthase [Streptomyces sp. NBC_00059]|uniref:beta-ketoacyl-[acyl-carrier-protein] synthase family protein n=1 Tax=Streptomyces sp. NBC_00059 TaxID=2975635 RepID=UPI002257BA49|nr:beta-ketoacyl-[acyl-carrier-protein] synthase family protein [Streptomyces sp. NBC_00059]MCX5415784.1 beta-ketoacyl-[acyl-carrier-protein] synthase family protein [Streptomyces sp. NBC_00059]
MDVKVLITGLGAVSTLGSGVEAFRRGLRAADSLPVETADPWADVPVKRMYLVPDTVMAPPHGRVSAFAVQAAEEAMADAGLEPASLDGSRTAVIVGTTIGDGADDERYGAAGASTDGSSAYGVSAAVAAAVGARGPAAVVGNACAASGYAVAMAADLIRSGAADVVVAGGAEAQSRVALACFNRMGAVDPERCRPFDAERRGTVFGEGAAVLVLESAEHVRRRGAPDRGYAEVGGSGWSCDAHHITSPEPGGEQIRRAMAEALEEAGIGAGDVGCVVPHGTGTELNDTVESEALAHLLDERLADTPLYSLKALIGHTGGAAGAFAVLTGALIAQAREVMPNARVRVADPRCPVWLPEDAPTPLDRPGVLVNAYGFGGNNISIALLAADRQEGGR